MTTVGKIKYKTSKMHDFVVATSYKRQPSWNGEINNNKIGTDLQDTNRQTDTI